MYEQELLHFEQNEEAKLIWDDIPDDARSEVIRKFTELAYQSTCAKEQRKDNNNDINETTQDHP